MKKLLLFVIACTLGLFSTVNAQETITIGEGGTTNGALPVDFYNGYGICQQLFTADEIGHADGGVITSMAIKFFGETTTGEPANPTTATFERKVDIYINSTELAELEGGVNLSAGQTPYFQGTVTYVPEEWTEFVFDTPYQYDGGNIIITMHDYTGGDYQNWYHFYADFIGKHAAYANITAKLTNEYLESSLSGLLWLSPSRNNIQLTFAAGEGGEEPEPTPEPEQPGGEELASEFSFDFEDGTLTGLRAFAGEGSNAPLLWTVTNDSYYSNGTNVIYSESCDYDWNAYPSINNYIVTENAYAITAESKLSWYVRNADYNVANADVYEVVVSEDGETFTQIWSGTAEMGVYEKELSLAESAGKNLYIGFRHYCTDEYGGAAIVLDNIVLTAGEGGGEEPTPEPEPEPTPVAPAAPTNVVATATETAITLTWDAVENATYYNIYTPNNYTGSNVYGLEATTYTFEGLTAGTEYCFEVSAVNDVDESDATKVCATTTAAEIEEPEQGPATVQIGEGTDYYTYFAPIYNYYQKYSISQVIYTAEEIGYGAGIISSISYNQATGGDNTRNIAVYLKNTDKECFVSEWETLTSELCVYDAEFVFGTTGWTTIELQEPFLYEGGNLLVCVIDKTGASKYDGYDSFYSYETGQTAEDARAVYASSYYSAIDPLNITQATTFIRTSLGSDVYSYRAPQVKIAIAPATADVKVEPETIALGEVQLGEYWSEKEATTVAVKVKPIMTTVTGITCDEDFFVLPTIDLTASPIEFEVAYNKNAAAGEYTGNLTITYGDGATKVVPMTATAYAPATPDVFELAQEITFTENTYTDTPVFANLKDDYNLPKEANAGNTPDAVYTFTLEKEMNVTVDVTGTNAIYAIYKEDFNGEGGPKSKNNDRGNLPVPSSFKYDFNGGVGLDDFTMVEYDGNNDHWQPFTDNGREAIVSYSYNYSTGISEGDNYMITNDVYAISADSKLSLAARGGGSFNGVADNIMVKVSTNGEEFTLIETVAPEATWNDYVVDLGAKFAELGLEYGNYYIALHHKCKDVYFVGVDDLTLTAGGNSEGGSVATNAVPYPAGKYYLVAAAEDAFTVNVAIEALETEEPIAPAAPTKVVATANGFNSIIVTWDAVEGAAKYVVYKDGEEFMSTSEYTPSTTVTIDGLEMGKEYCFAVKAVANGLESELSETVCQSTESLPENQVLVGEATTSYLTPFVTALGNAWVEMIYKAEEIGKAGKIAEIAYSYNRGGEVTADIDIYFAEVTKSVFASPADVTPVTDLKLVYSGTGVTLCESEWETFVLDTQFEYSGENNLLVVVATSNASGQNYWNSYSEANTVLIKDNMLESKKPVMLLTLAEEVVPEPVVPAAPVVAAEATSDTTIVLTWAAVEGATSYNVYSADTLVEKVTVTTYTVEGLTAETEYTFVVKSVNEVGESEASNVATAKTLAAAPVVPEPVVPAAPVVAAEATSDTTIVLTWAAVEGATSYNVYSADTLVEKVTVTTYTVEGLTAETEYTFVVKSVNEVGESEASNEATAKTLAAAPVVPEPVVPAAPVVAVDTVTETTVTLTWAAVEGATSYNVYSADTLVANVKETTYTVEGLTAETEYTFVVKAVNEVGESEASNVATAKTLAAAPVVPEPVVPAAPVVAVDTVTETTVTLTWAAVEGATSYNVYSADTLVANVKETTYTVEGLTAETEYTFVVKAVNEVGESEASNVATAKTLAAAPVGPTVPAAPVLTVTVSYDTIQVRWEPVAGATSYRLYYKGELQDEFEDPALDIQVPTQGKYCFNITAVNEVGESEPAEACADVVAPEGMVAPAAPVLNATLDGDVAVLSWSAVEFGTYYNVYLLTPQSEMPYQYLGTSKDTSVKLQLEAKGEYCFFVTAQNLVGESKESNTACVNYGEGVEENVATFNIYPNPVSDKLVIETEATIEAVTIYSLTGVMVYAEVDFNNNMIDVTDFASGVYFIKVRTENGEAVQRFIKK